MLLNIIKRLISFCGVFAMTLGLFGCSRFLIYDSQKDDDAMREEAKGVARDVLKTLENKDRKAFRALFHEQICVLSDYDEGEAYTFEVFSGTVASISQESFHTGGHIASKGESYTTATSGYNVVTDDNEYLLCVEYYTKHDNDKYIGKIIKMKILNSKYAPESGYFADMSLRYGIYYPGWLDHFQQND